MHALAPQSQESTSLCCSLIFCQGSMRSAWNTRERLVAMYKHGAAAGVHVFVCDTHAFVSLHARSPQRGPFCCACGVPVRGKGSCRRRHKLNLAKSISSMQNIQRESAQRKELVRSFRPPHRNAAVREVKRRVGLQCRGAEAPPLGTQSTKALISPFSYLFATRVVGRLLKRAHFCRAPQA